MATLGTQNISTSYPQVLKTVGTTPFTGTLLAVASGDESSTSALQISTTGVKSSGTFAVDGASLLSGNVTLGGSFTLSTGTATLGTASISTATISTASISTATISTATIPNILGATTFSSTITASTGTNTLGTISVNTATVGTLSTLNGLSVTTTATVGTLEIGAAGPSITNMTYGTAAFTLSTVAAYNAAGTTNGTVALTGVAINDIVIGSLNSLGSATGSTGLIIGFHPIASSVVRYSITNPTTTAGTVPAGVLHMTAMRFTA